jgi:predicted MFS family arabinose efflux permease
MQARGALIPSFQASFRVSESQLGLITPLGTLGFVGPVVIVGALAGRLDIQRSVVLGLVLAAGGLVLIGTSSNFLALLLFVALQSAALGIFRALDRPILSHLHPENRGRMFSLETMAWAVGAMLGPFLVTWVLTRSDWRLTYYVLGAAYIPIAIIAWRLEFPDAIASEQSIDIAEIRPLLSNPAILGMGLVLILVGGIESTFFTWLPYYSTEFLPRSAANLALSIYLAAYVPGRLAFGLLADRVSPPDVVLAAATLLVGLLVVLFGIGGFDRLPFYAVVFASGLFISGFFPLLLTWGVEVAPDYTGPVNAFAMVSVQIGFFLVPASVGVLADRYSIEAAMLIPIVLAGLMVLVLSGHRLAGLQSMSR